MALLLGMPACARRRGTRGVHLLVESSHRHQRGTDLARKLHDRQLIAALISNPVRAVTVPGNVRGDFEREAAARRFRSRPGRGRPLIVLLGAFVVQRQGNSNAKP